MNASTWCGLAGPITSIANVKSTLPNRSGHQAILTSFVDGNFSKVMTYESVGLFQALVQLPESNARPICNQSHRDPVFTLPDFDEIEWSPYVVQSVYLP